MRRPQEITHIPSERHTCTKCAI